MGPAPPARLLLRLHRRERLHGAVRRITPLVFEISFSPNITVLLAITADSPRKCALSERKPTGTHFRSTKPHNQPI